LIADPQAAARAWYEKNKVIPINHLLAVQRRLADARPDVVKEIYRVLSESKQAAPAAADGIDFFPFGFEANRKPLETIVQYAFEQKIIPRKFAADEVFAEARQILGA
jgi:4,5-dihydroxyphthalate decarboxylase